MHSPRKRAKLKTSRSSNLLRSASARIAQLEELLSCKQVVVGSNPASGSTFESSAMVEHLTVNQVVAGSSPASRATYYKALFCQSF